VSSGSSKSRAGCHGWVFKRRSRKGALHADRGGVECII
jgi:hypothetical protein